MLLIFLFDFYCRRVAHLFFFKAAPSLCVANGNVARNVNLVCSWLLPRPGAI